MSSVTKLGEGLLSSTRVVWCAAVAAVAGGVLGGFGISAPLLLFGGQDVGFSAYRGLMEDLNLMASLGLVLTTASLVGLYTLSGGFRIWGAGVICAGLSFGALLVLFVDELLGYPLSGSYLLIDEPSRFVEALFFLSFWGRQLGLLSLGVAALSSGVMGHWRFLPLAICFLEAPVVADALLPLVKILLDNDAHQTVASLLLLGLPGWRSGLVGSVGWILMGYVFLRSGLELRCRRARAAARAVEHRNRMLARRLYGEAWGTGDLSVVEELISPDFLDHRCGSRGATEYGRALASLRRSFPDLRLSIEEQRAEGDTVTTRCVFLGTDRGGVLWYPPTGREATFTGTFTDRFSGGRIVEHWGKSDTAGLLAQLGLPLPGN